VDLQFCCFSEAEVSLLVLLKFTFTTLSIRIWKSGLFLIKFTHNPHLNARLIRVASTRKTSALDKPRGLHYTEVYCTTYQVWKSSLAIAKFYFDSITGNVGCIRINSLLLRFGTFRVSLLYSSKFLRKGSCVFWSRRTKLIHATAILILVVTVEVSNENITAERAHARLLYAIKRDGVV